MNNMQEAPDRRFWTTYDYYKIEQEARALRRAEIYALFGKVWARVRAELAHAGAQPAKVQRKPANA